MLAHFFRVEFYKRTVSKFRKRLRKLLSCVPVLEKKCDARAKLLFCQSKHIAFVPFSLLLPSSLLKFPNCQLVRKEEGMGVGRECWLKGFIIWLQW